MTGHRSITAWMLLTLGIVATPLHAAPADVPTSPWGPDDTLGAVNRLSPEKVLEAARSSGAKSRIILTRSMAWLRAPTAW